ncbi:MAG TPA: hypothetical protein VEJ63_02880 [Planctomycetota bacterium]|nr:hypothetical protein [Planctomycetota bacterium]
MTLIDFYFGLSLRFVLEGIAEDKRPEEFTEAIQNFLKLTDADREKTSTYVYSLYTQFAESHQLPLKLKSPADVWKHAMPEEIRVTRRRRNNKVYVAVLLDCDWDRESWQIVYRKGNELVRVSKWDCHFTNADAYGKPDGEDRICW